MDLARIKAPPTNGFSLLGAPQTNGFSLQVAPQTNGLSWHNVQINHIRPRVFFGLCDDGYYALGVIVNGGGGMPYGATRVLVLGMRLVCAGFSERLT